MIKGYKEVFGDDYLNFGNGIICAYILYNLNMYSLSYFNYTPIILLREARFL